MDKSHFLLASWHVLLSAIGVVLIIGKNFKHNKWMMLCLILTSLPGVNHVLSDLGLGITHFSSSLHDPVWHLSAYPAIYLYVRAIVFPEKDFKWLDLVHFSPILIIWIYSQNQGYVSAGLLNDESFHNYSRFMGLMALLYIVVYGFFVHKIVRQNEQRYQEEYTQNNIFITLKWVDYLLATTFIITLCAALISIGFEEKVVDKKDDLMTSLIVMFTGALVFFASRQRTLFVQEPNEIPLGVLAIDHDKRVEADLDTDYLKKLEAYMRSHKPYLNPKLRIQELSQAIDIPRHVLSRIINENYQVNFFYFVNKYRVDHLKNLLTPENLDRYTIEALAFKSGYNSKSTFYKSFKDITGENPSQFVKKLKRQD